MKQVRARVLPDDAAELLQRAAQTPRSMSCRPYSPECARARAVDSAVARVKEQYPHYFRSETA
ncbi:MULTISPECIES: hypothetical protein [Burkholderia]|uniref:Uncharacterized protein n=1 Tax=Burkholderia contaminans TaxID=488447 RepID=A0A2S5DRK6_9BURK|nr:MULTISPECIES: hypothetical protein [Burkholderia]EKS9794857.1 hypothetical protein [Burkholderia cepacia]EKS9802812.1 hypothetical protein [Burkholderia cepacia]EKS9809319.1 hypothetical protein [Burkholderia cepacia]EKS9818180.1 hypothetical protein [Burkholderia cepacia]EKS9831344.1 hypothetical protein [Burkholderia cepacia]